MEQLSIAVVFTAIGAGFISFISPCVLPLIPAYLSYITGMSLEDMRGTGDRPRRFSPRVLILALCFVLGFSVVFIAFGASASAIGQYLMQNQYTFAWIGGLLITIFGFQLAGFFQKPKFLHGMLALTTVVASLWLINVLDQPTALSLLALCGFVFAFFWTGLSNRILALQAGGMAGKRKGGGYISSFILGFALAFGWTPCIGPILGTILAVAATQETVWQGVMLLSFYSLGLGIPFIICALFINLFFGVFSKLLRFMPVIELVAGLILIIVGALVFSGRLNDLIYLLPQYSVG